LEKRRHQEEGPSLADGYRLLSGRLRSVALVLTLWTTFGFLLAARSILRMPHATWSDALQSVMPQCYAWALITPLIFAADRRLLCGMAPGWRVLSHVPIALLLMPIPVSVDYVIQKARQAPWLPGSLWENFEQQFVSAAMIYSVIVGVSMAGSYRSEARRREREAARLALHAAQLESQLAEARLHALQSQLNPHFLFNTLNTISAFTETDPRTARQMMACLGKLLRASLDHAGRQEVAIKDELAFLEDYLMIERLRFEDRITVDVRAEDDTLAALVPSFILQPLVENAIRHGAAVLRRKSHIQVSVRQSDGRLVIRVEDDGAGLPEGWRLEDHGGVGLSNIARRLRELYRAEQMFTLSRRPEGGVRAEAALPLHWEKSAPAASLHAETL
jgi:two-component system LytT family sensor kinase